MYLLQTNAQSPNVLIYSRVRHIQFSFRHANIESLFCAEHNNNLVMCKKTSLKYETPSRKPVVYINFGRSFFCIYILFEVFVVVFLEQYCVGKCYPFRDGNLCLNKPVGPK